MAGVTTDLTLKTKVQGADSAKAKLSGVSSSMKKLGLAVAATGVAITALGIKFTKVAIKSAVEFEKSMANINTLLLLDKKAIDAFGDEVLKLSKRVPVKGSVLSAALYDVVSAGITDTADAMEVLEQAAILGEAGLGSTAQAVDIMTSAMNSYGKSAEDAADISDIIFKTVRDGKNTVEQLSGAFGNLAPLAASVGVSLEELSAGTAAITVTGKSASEAQTGLAAAITALIKPNETMLDIFDQLNVKTGTELIESSGGLVNALGLVREATIELDVMESKALGRKEALVTSIALLGEQNETFTTTLEDMKNGSNAVSAAFAIQAETAASNWRILKNNLTVVMIKLGSAILPALIPVVQQLSQWFDSNEQNIKAVAESIGENLPKAINVAVPAIKTVIGWLQKMWEMVSKLIGGLRDLAEGLRKAASIGVSGVSSIIPGFSSAAAFSNANSALPINGTLDNNRSVGGDTIINVSGVFGSDAGEEVGDMIMSRLAGHVAV